MNRTLYGVLIVAVTVISQIALAQIPDSLLEDFKFRNIGPAGMSGRITAIDVNLSNQDHILVGSASGGLWESKDGGISWKPIFDQAGAQSIGAVKLNQRNPLEIWVGTGEGNPRNSHNSGNGVYRTNDGGITWKNMGLEASRLIHRLIIDPYDPAIVYVGAMGSAWGPNPERGLYKTTDSGENWERVLYINDSTGIGDVVMDPQNHQKLIAATWEFGRTPWSFTSGGPGSGLHITFDGGETWKKITSKDGLPNGDLGRIGLAMATNKPNIIYALVEAKENGLYKSEDGGLHWKLVSTKDIGNRPFYYCEIYVDPSNENRIWNLWSYVSKSEDGGRTFETILDYGKGVHPDHHAFWISPTNPDLMMNGNDGGFNISRDGGKNWRFVTNLPVGQFYHIAVDTDYPYRVYGGMQDNGSWIGPAYVLKAGGIRNADWREVLFGDGFDVLPYRADNRYGWAMWQEGNLNYYDYETGFTEYQRPIHPEGVPLRYSWNAALAQNPFHDCGIYYGSQFVHKSLDCGRNWEIISPDLTTNDTTKQKQEDSGGLTLDVTGAENHTTILVIAPSPVDEDVIWVGTDDGNVQVTRDGGESWALVSARMPGMPNGAWIPQIEVSQSNAGEAFVVVNNYRQNDWTPYLYHTKDYGQTFERRVGTGDVASFVLSIVLDPVEPNLVFLGADDGLYVSIDGGHAWQKWAEKGFPPVQVSDMKIQSSEHDLVLGTFGRAIWILDDIRPLREIAKSHGDILNSELAVFPAPDAVLASYRSVDGIRFTADAEYRGDNRPGGARLTVWYKGEDSEKDSVITLEPEPGKEVSSRSSDKKKDKKEDLVEMPADSSRAEVGERKKKDDKLKIIVLDTSADTIRQFTRKIEPGFNRFSWDMSHNGVRMPSRQDIEDDADPPTGRPVIPGNYKIIVAFNDSVDSTSIRVMKDPRREVTDEMLVARNAALLEFESLVKASADGFDQLKQAKKTVQLLEKAIVNAPDTIQEDVKKQGKEITGKIDSLMEIYMLPADAKGIPEEYTKLESIIGMANYYLQNSPGKPGGNAMDAEKDVRRQLQETLDKVNTFIDEDWNAYISKMKEIEFDLFGSLEHVGMPSSN